jgi:hypothetical protein
MCERDVFKSMHCAAGIDFGQMDEHIYEMREMCKEERHGVAFLFVFLFCARSVCIGA